MNSKSLLTREKFESGFFFNVKTLFFVFFLVLGFSPFTVNAAIEVNTITTSNSAQNVNTHTFAAIQDGGDELAMIVQLSLIDGGDVNPSVGVTYGGQNMTLAKSQGSGAGGLDRISEIWYLLDPPTGSNNVVITLSGSITRIIAAATALSGVDQNDPLDSTAGISQTGDSATWNIFTTTQNDNAIIFEACTQQNVYTVTADSSQTTNYNINSDNRGWGAYKLTTAASTYYMNYTLASAANGTMALASFKESLGIAPTSTLQQSFDNLNTLILNSNNEVAEMVFTDLWPYYLVFTLLMSVALYFFVIVSDPIDPPRK